MSGGWPGFADWRVSPELRATYQRDGDWAGFHHVQLACSRDLHRWERLAERRPFIDLSPRGAGAYDLAWFIGGGLAVVAGFLSLLVRTRRTVPTPAPVTG